MSRTAEIRRNTKETRICVSLNLDGSGQYQIQTGIGFFDHMLTTLAFYAGWGMQLSAQGDLQVDGHHTVEDVGIVLGQAFRTALGNYGGIHRYGLAFVPMDEALGFCAADISGRPFLVFQAELPEERVGTFDTCMAKEFFRAFSTAAGITLHLRAPYGENSHHILEAIFKAAAHALQIACTKTTDGQTLSTKGMLD